MKTSVRLAAGVVLFAVLGTANSGGYRFGVSDQAFYVPATAMAGDPALFPRDRTILEVQTGLMAADDALALAARLTGLDLPTIFLAAYVVTIGIFSIAAIAFARTLGLSWPATSAALLLLTLRHRITKTGANSLEGYMHPRQLAFALGVAAWTLALRGRPGWAAAITGAAALLHPTTALWFAASLVAAEMFRRRHATARLAAVLAAVGAAAILALWAGPLAGRLSTMDSAWLSVLADKDYLFPGEWPLYAWALNLGSAATVGVVFLARRRSGAASSGEAAFVAGLVALVAVFFVSVPLTEARLALAVQLQVNRIFWLVDFVLAVYLAWWLTGPTRLAGRRGRGRALAAVAVLVAVSVGRGGYLLTVEHAERQLIERDLPETAWTDVTRWIEAQPAHWHVLADPGHAWKHGSSVRVAARRDTLLEAGKDTAMAMYDRDVALRVGERIAALTGFEDFTSDRIRTLGARYDLDVAVVTRAMSLDFPVLYRNAEFVVYDLR